MSQKEFIRVEHVSKVFQKRNWRGKVSETRAVEDLSLTIYEGETLGLVGESGSGKSTLAKMILGLEKPTSGEIQYVDQVSGACDGGLQVIYQDPFSALNPYMTALDIVKEPLTTLSKSEATEKARLMLERVGITGDDVYKRPKAFSGGQRQRIGIARAVVSNPRFIVCDEPTSALDVSIQAQILEILQELQEELHLSYLFISHDLSVVRHISDRIAVMYRGHLVEVASAEELFQDPKHPYTQYLLQAKMELEPALARQKLVDMQTDIKEFTVDATDPWEEVSPGHFVRQTKS